jgi:archaellum component FlaC
VAIQTLLRNPVAYVWGPPGTGKTRHVLAETVTHLMGEGKRVLVTASTNLAVDNALDAILTINRSRQTEILRVGVPTSEFSKKWPDSCEERALKNKLADLEKQENLITRRIHAPERINQLRELLPKQETRAEELRSGITKAELTLAVIDGEVLELDARASVLSHEFSTIESQHQKFREERAALQYSEIKQGVEALEREQMGLIGTKQQTEEDLHKLGMLSRMFTKKPTRLNEHLEAQTARLAQVETTLGSQREILSKVAEQDARLESKIASLDRRLADVMDEKDWVLQSLAAKRKESDEIQIRLATSRTELERLSVDLSKLHLEYEELANLGPPPGDQELADLQNQLADVRQRKLRINQNLSVKSVIGTTMDGFIGLTMNQAMQFDHIIVDEAGYAPLAKVIPLLLMHCPVSLLGDHKQLPPVYEGENDSLSESYWGTSALYLEEALRLVSAMIRIEWSKQ